MTSTEAMAMRREIAELEELLDELRTYGVLINKHNEIKCVWRDLKRLYRLLEDAGSPTHVKGELYA